MKTIVSLSDRGGCALPCAGFAPDARIATAMGAVPAGEIWEGDRVLTAQGEAAPVLEIRRMRWPAGDAAAVAFAPGTIGNAAPLRLAPEQRFLLAGREGRMPGLVAARDLKRSAQNLKHWFWAERAKHRTVAPRPTLSLSQV